MDNIKNSDTSDKTDKSAQRGIYGFTKTKDIPEAMRPYEKFLAAGASCLSDAELLAIIIKTGAKGISSIELASRILCLASEDGSLAGLTDITFNRLMTLRGIGRVKALQILAVIELSKRISKANASVRLDFNSPSAVAGYYMEDLRHSKREQLVVAMLDTKLRFIGDEVISIGTVNASIVSPREVFIAAMKRDAVYIVIVHNHPSGDPSPSSNDISITKRLQLSGRLLGISLIDHIIIGDNRFISLKDEGLMGLNE